VPAGAQWLELLRTRGEGRCLRWRLLGSSGSEVCAGVLRPEGLHCAGMAPFQLVGSWDGWAGFVEMQPLTGSPVCAASVELPPAPVPRAVQFQVLQGQDWASRFHPSTDGAEILGPHASHGINWEAWLPAGCRRFNVTWDPRGCRSIAWRPLGIFGELPEVPRPLSGPEFSIAGSWDKWAEFTAFMPAGELSFHAHIPMQAADTTVEFQVFAGRSWEQRFYPAAKGGGVLGPSQRSGMNWHVELLQGCRWLRVVWRPRGQSHRLTWSCLSPAGEALGAAEGARHRRVGRKAVAAP